MLECHLRCISHEEFLVACSRIDQRSIQIGAYHGVNDGYVHLTEWHPSQIQILLRE